MYQRFYYLRTCIQLHPFQLSYEERRKLALTRDHITSTLKKKLSNEIVIYYHSAVFFLLHVLLLYHFFSFDTYLLSVVITNFRYYLNQLKHPY